MGPHTPLMSSCTTSRLEACGTGGASELTAGRGSSHASHAPHRSPSMRPRAGGLWELQVRTRTAGGPRRRLHEPSHPVPAATRHAPSASEPVPQRWHAPQLRVPPPATRVDGPVRRECAPPQHAPLPRSADRSGSRTSERQGRQSRRSANRCQPIGRSSARNVLTQERLPRAVRPSTSHLRHGARIRRRHHPRRR